MNNTQPPKYTPIVNEYIKDKVLKLELFDVLNFDYFILKNRYSVFWAIIPITGLILYFTVRSMLLNDFTFEYVTEDLFGYALLLVFSLSYLYFALSCYFEVKRIYALPFSEIELDDLRNWKESKEIIADIQSHKNLLDRYDLIYVSFALEQKLKENNHELEQFKSTYKSGQNKLHNNEFNIHVEKYELNINSLNVQIRKIEQMLPVNKSLELEKFIKSNNESTNAAKSLTMK